MSAFSLWYCSTILWFGVLMAYAFAAPRVPPGFAFAAVPIAMLAGLATVAAVYLVLIEVVVAMIRTLFPLIGVSI